MWRVVLMGMIACSKTRQPAQIATEPWALATYAHGGAVMSLGVRLAFVEASGYIRWKISLESTGELRNLRSVGDVLVTIVEHRLRVIDAATGRERWRRSDVEGVRLGTRALALTNGEVLDARSGSTLASPDPTTRWVDAGPDGFLLASGEAIRSVDEHGVERWRQAIAEATSVRYTETTAIVRTATKAFVELDLATGRVVARGAIAQDRPGAWLGTSDEGDSFYQLEDAVVARDAAGRVRWQRPARGYADHLRVRSEGQRVALLGSGNAATYLIDLHGTVDEPPAGAGAFVGFSGPCALLLMSETLLRCVEVATGVGLWAAEVRGEVCPRTAGAIVVGDGRAVSLDVRGKRLWQIDVPRDAQLACAADDTALVITSGNDERDDHASSVLDVTTGKLTAVAL